jgi:hypothetical protein
VVPDREGLVAVREAVFVIREAFRVVREASRAPGKLGDQGFPAHFVEAGPGTGVVVSLAHHNLVVRGSVAMVLADLFRFL